MSWIERVSKRRERRAAERAQTRWSGPRTAFVLAGGGALLDLAPLSTYTFRVGSTDEAGNGPTFSANGTFNTQGAPGDITAPVISNGPTVVFVDQTSAIVEWTTDEPSSSVVEYGLDATFGSTIDGDPGRFRQVHRVRLTGLSADTQYSALVRSADPDGNAIASSLFTFRTLAVPDTAAPVIARFRAFRSRFDARAVLAGSLFAPQVLRVLPPFLTVAEVSAALASEERT